METSRRQRQRAATLAEIMTTARTLLTTKGAAAVTINAVAREMGMSGPALYRYYSGHDELVAAMAAEFYRELTEWMTSAADESDPGSGLLAICRAMRAWAIANPAEFRWIFASPAPRGEPESPRQQAGQRFEQAFLDQVVAIWRARPFPVPELRDLAPALRKQLRAYSAEIGGRLPPAAAHVFLTCWVRLYGLLCMEILNQLDFAYSDLEPVFEDCLRELCERLGVDYRG